MGSFFSTVFDTSGRDITVSDFLLCIAAALVIGLFLAAVCRWKKGGSGSFLITIAMLPAVVAVVIMMVNGNIGAGVAVAGTFSLVRFRSAPGTAREIVSIFLAMGCGLVCGMGYLGYAVLFAVILGLCMMAYTAISERKGKREEKILRITIPEDLDYDGVFEDLLGKYTGEHELLGVKTTNLGSLFKLTYQVSMKDPAQEKQMMDEIRVRNGNLEISLLKKGDDPNVL